VVARWRLGCQGQAIGKGEVGDQLPVPASCDAAGGSVSSDPGG
jgi:hypothetical protein